MTAQCPASVGDACIEKPVGPSIGMHRTPQALEDVWSKSIPAPAPHVLCDTCQTLFEDESTWVKYDPVTDGLLNCEDFSRLARFTRPWRTLGDLRGSAVFGCHLCTTICWNLIEDNAAPWGFERQIPEPTGLGVRLLEYDDMPDSLNLQVCTICVESFYEPLPLFELLVFAASEKPGLADDPSILWLPVLHSDSATSIKLKAQEGFRRFPGNEFDAQRRAELAALEAETEANSLKVVNLDSHAAKQQEQWKEVIKERMAPGELDETPSSPTSALAWIRARLSSCKKNHTACNQNYMAQINAHVDVRPRRLLYLSREAGSAMVRLVEVSDDTQAMDYVTVSHRWESEPQHELQLTSSTHAQLEAGVPLSQLPVLFQDIIYLVQHLGLSYLWVDTLCIFQKDGSSNVNADTAGKVSEERSLEDWTYHARAMAFIYGRAVINICASSGSHQQRLIREERSRLVYMHGYHQPKWKSFTRAIFQFPREDRWHDFFGHDSLFERGWVFQERMLSPRVIYFQKRQVYWQCRQADCAELSSREQVPARNRSPQMELALLFDQTGSNADHVLHRWGKTVEDYSRTVTTYEEDRLYAIAGIALMLRELFWNKLLAEEESRYHAGLWQYRLPIQLCWIVSEEEPKKPPENYRAPLWSWASVNGSIAFRLLPQTIHKGLTMKTLVEIPHRGVHVRPVGSEFGPCDAGASLRLWCNLCQISVGPDPMISWHDMLVLIAREDDGMRDTTWRRPHEQYVWWDSIRMRSADQDSESPSLYFLPISLAEALQSESEDEWEKIEITHVSQRASNTTTKEYCNGATGTSSQIYLSDMHVSFRKDSKYYRHRQDETNGDPSDLSFCCKITGLILQPTKDKPGQYKRVGLAETIESWWSLNGAPCRPECIEAFRKSGLTAEAGEILSQPVPHDPAVYEIEII